MKTGDGSGSGGGANSRARRWGAPCCFLCIRYCSTEAAAEMRSPEEREVFSTSSV